ncbi:MAG: TRAP transporter small permease [Proteobacteria bacterium]|nr:TRAP transporter small permease [Pseudomonadota bacterium]
MTESQESRAQDFVGKWLGRLCRWMAVLGGVVLVAITLMSVASIAGRSLLGRPVPGDFELVQIGTAICVAAFLPWCQMQGGNIIVDFFTAHASERAQALLDVFGALLLAAVMLTVAWRTGVGALTVKASGETSMIMGFPSWIGYAFMVPGFALTALAGLYTGYISWRRSKA